MSSHRRSWSIVAVVCAAMVLPLASAGASTTSSPYRAFSSGSWWNTPLPVDAPRHVDSDAIISYLKSDNVADGCVLLAGAGTDTWGTPVYWPTATDPVYAVASTLYKLPPEFGSLRIPRGALPSNNSDAEMTVFDRESGYVAWLWGAAYDSSKDTWSARGGSVAYLASNGLHGKLPESDEPRNGGAQRGLNGAIVTSRYDEVAAGSIDHVLRIGVNTAHSDFVFPMVGSDGTTTYQYAPPQGARLRIKPTVDLSQYGLHPEALVIANALQRYGAVVGDSTGGGIVTKLEDTVSEGRGQLWTLDKQALCSIPIEAFEVIEHGYIPPVSTTSPDSDQNTAPVVTITAPADGSTASAGTDITFSGTVSDEDTGLEQTISWASDLAGSLGSGGTITATLTAGVHRISATVVDSGGATGSAAVTLTVEEPSATATTVSVPAIDYAWAGRHLDLRVTAVDDLGAAVGGATVGLAISRDGVLYATSTVTTDASGVGTVRLSKAPSGCYTSAITAVSAGALTWDLVTPANSSCTSGGGSSGPGGPKSK